MSFGLERQVGCRLLDVLGFVPEGPAWLRGSGFRALRLSGCRN